MQSLIIKSREEDYQQKEQVDDPKHLIRYESQGSQLPQEENKETTERTKRIHQDSDLDNSESLEGDATPMFPQIVKNTSGGSKSGNSVKPFTFQQSPISKVIGQKDFALLKQEKTNKSKRESTLKNILDNAIKGGMNKEDKSSRVLKQIINCNLDKLNLNNEVTQEMELKASVLTSIQKFTKEAVDSSTSESDSDDETQLKPEDFNPGAQSQYQNKTIFRKNYGVEFQFPTMYVLDAKLFPLDPSYFIRVVKYVKPENMYQVQCYNYSELNTGFQTPEPPSKFSKTLQLKEKQKYKSYNIVFQLMKKQDNQLQVIDEATVESSSKITIAFSPNTNYLAIVDNQTQSSNKISQIKVFTIEQNVKVEEALRKLIKKIGTQFKKPDIVFDQDPIFESQVQIRFGLKSQLLAAFNDHEIVLFNLQDKIHQFTKFSIHETNFIKRICAIDFYQDSAQEQGFKLEAALELKNNSVAIVGDEFFNIDYQEKQLKNYRKIKFTKISPDINVKFSEHFKSVMIYNDKKLILLEKIDGQYFQKQLSQIKNNLISYIEAQGEGFIYIGNKPYDKGMHLFYSLDDDFQVSLNQSLRPGSNFKIFDVEQIDRDENGMGSKLIVLSVENSHTSYHELHPRKTFDSDNCSESSFEAPKRRSSSLVPIHKKKNSDNASFMNTLMHLPTTQDVSKERKKKSRNTGKVTMMFKSLCNAVMWPFVAEADSVNNIWLGCCYHQDKVSKISLGLDPEEEIIQKIFITEASDMYVLTHQFYQKKYRVWRIDLNQMINIVENQEQKGFQAYNILEFNESCIGNGQLLDFMARSSDIKKDPLSNTTEYINILTPKGVYNINMTHTYEKQADDPKIPPSPQNLKKQKSKVMDQKLEMILQAHSHMRQFVMIDSNSFFIDSMKELKEDGQQCLQIMKVTLNSNSIKAEQYHAQLFGVDSCLLKFHIDVETMRLFVLTKSIMHRMKKYLIIYDLLSGDLFGRCKVEDEEIIGIMKQQHFSIKNGHLYYDNHVIKFRYDCISQIKTEFCEQKLFYDKYYNILDLQKGQRVFQDMPIMSVIGNKQIYFVDNYQKKQACRIIIMPFLHDRKIFLKSHLDSQTTFTTVVEVPSNVSPVHVSSKPKIKQVMSDSLMIQVSFNENSISVFTQAGVLVKQHDFSPQIETFGQPVEVSSNGQYFLFQQQDNQQVVNIMRLQWDKGFVFDSKVDLKEAMDNFINDLKSKARGSKEEKYANHLQDRIENEFQAYFVPQNQTCNFQINNHKDLVVQIFSKVDMVLYERFSQMFSKIEQNIIWNAILEMGKEQSEIESNSDKELKKHEKKESFERSKSLRTGPQFLRQGTFKLEKLKTDQGLIKYVRKQDRLKLSLKTQALMEREFSFFRDLGSALINKGPIYFVVKTKHLVGRTNTSYIGQITDQFMNITDQVMTLPKNAQKILKKKMPILKMIPFGQVQETIENDEQDDHQQGLIFPQDFCNNDEFEIEPGKFLLGYEKLFAWDDYTVVYFDLSSDLQTPKLNKLNLNIHTDSAFQIDNVEQGCNPSLLTIKIKQSSSSMMVIVWDLIKNCELNSYDVCSNSLTFYDKEGNLFIQDGENRVIVTEQNVVLKSFQVDCHYYNNFTLKNGFTFQKGQRVDSNFNNWVLFNDYISLSFSFMTFVIRDQFNKNLHAIKDINLDPEAFKFNINKRTFLTCNNFVATDSEALKVILTKLEVIDPDLLHQLNYYCVQKKVKAEVDEKNFSLINDIQKEFLKVGEIMNRQIIEMLIMGQQRVEIEDRITPLKLAISNSRSRNIILNFMAKIGVNTSGNICHLFEQLINDQYFKVYIDSMLFQTQLMKLKNVISVKQAWNDKIISIVPNNCQYIDDNFFQKKMNEDKSNSTYIRYQVNILSLKADWILDIHGKMFLLALDREGDNSLFKSQTIMVIIEYLFKIIKFKILIQQIPLYIAQLLMFFASVFLPTDTLGFKLEDTAWIDVLNILICAALVVMFGLKCYQMGIKVVMTIYWNYFDAIYFATVIYISRDNLKYDKHREISLGVHQFDVLNEGITISGEKEREKWKRYFQAFLSITIWFKAFYFMRLHDEVSPLIIVITNIVKDIKWFSVILIMAMFAFATSFYLIGINQIEFGNPEEIPPYGTFGGALMYVYVSALGEVDNGSFKSSDRITEFVLDSLFVFMTFLLLINMFNMLIAIMGNTFEENNRTKNINQLKSHLQFVLDNWYIIDFIKDKDSIQYLIAAIVKEEDNKQTEMIDMIKQEFKLLNQRNDEMDADIAFLTNFIQKIDGKIK